MIRLARSPSITGFMQRNARASALARRFVGGAGVAEVARTAVDLKRRGFDASLFYLGEYVSDPQLVQTNTTQKIAIAEELRRRGLDVHVSIDPTQVGYRISDEVGRNNALAIGRAIAAQPRTPRSYLMLDMEDYGVVDKTLTLAAFLRGEGIPVALTLQAYLKRTERDLTRIIEAGPSAVRLVKGAFAESKERAWQSRRDIIDNYLRLSRLMLSDRARSAGFYPIFGTHDDAAARAIINMADKQGWKSGEYELEMLYGVRPRLQEDMRDAGQRVRLYLPFGEDWWPYAARRIGENPRNALFVLRAVAGSRAD
jgi:proline dehydrogenase